VFVRSAPIAPADAHPIRGVKTAAYILPLCAEEPLDENHRVVRILLLVSHDRRFLEKVTGVTWQLTVSTDRTTVK
jgi:hypothetical protein